MSIKQDLEKKNEKKQLTNKEKFKLKQEARTEALL